MLVYVTAMPTETATQIEYPFIAEIRQKSAEGGPLLAAARP